MTSAAQSSRVRAGRDASTWGSTTYTPVFTRSDTTLPQPGFSTSLVT